MFVGFRLYSGAKDTSVSTALYSPAFEKVLKNNVNDKTFGDWIENMEKTVQEPNRAFFQMKSVVQNNEAYKCKVNMKYEKKFTTILKKQMISNSKMNGKVKVKFYLLFFQLELVWTSIEPLFSSSVAMKKESPYFKFLRRAIMDLTENGWLDIYLKRQSQQLTDCISEENVGNPLGYLKIATLFYVLGIGIILSGFIFIFEYCLNHSPKIVKTYQTNEKEEIVNLMQSLIMSIPIMHGELKTKAEKLVEQFMNENLQKN